VWDNKWVNPSHTSRRRAKGSGTLSYEASIFLLNIQIMFIDYKYIFVIEYILVIKNIIKFIPAKKSTCVMVLYTPIIENSCLGCG
jgi:hypothetical protein